MDKILVVVVVFVTVCNFPSTQQFPRDWSKTPYSQHTLMFSNFNPRFSYKPDDFVSAFGSDAISTNTFSDPIQNTEIKPENEQFEEAEAQTQAASQEPAKKDAPKPEDDEEDAPWPFKPNQKSRNVYSSFFPIMIQGGSRGYGRDAADYVPGSSTAIANSFSTGRGGVASSHATSFGDPYLSMLFRNAVFKKALEKNE